DECAVCGSPDLPADGGSRVFAIAAGGLTCRSCRPPGAATPSAHTVALVGALLRGDWAQADAAERRHQVECSGLVAAYLKWPREPSIRSLRHVERVWGISEGPRMTRPDDGRAPRRRGVRVGRSPDISPRGARKVRPPDPHPGGARPPAIPPELLPRHVALVMDGNGRWAKQRGLPRTEGHKRGESALFDVIMGAIELGIPYLSAYAFSTENWRRSPDEVRFLMGFNRDVIRRRRDQLHEMGVRVRWAGRRPRLWRSVISELEDAERMTAGNS